MSERASRLRAWAEFTGFLFAVAALVAIELAQHPEYRSRPASIFAYTPNFETTWVGLIILVAPLIWWLGERRRMVSVALPALEPSETGPVIPPKPQVDVVSTSVVADQIAETTESIPESSVSTLPPNVPARSTSTRAIVISAILLSFVLGAIHVAATIVIGRLFDSMPPAYHDEYSYLFQTKTFLAGRLYFPTHPQAQFFDQMHVLNDDGVFASRYFPGVGLWLAPWVALGVPYAASYLAGGLIVICVFWIAWELGSIRGDIPAGGLRLGMGLLASLFCAIAPAMLLFGNLLLSHHATTLGLMYFTLAYFRSLRTDGLLWPIVGGLSLGLATLCRPLTAFGFAIPFAIYLVCQMFRGEVPRPRLRAAAAVVPVGAALLMLATYNATLTGSPLRSPYGEYTRIYTPNHVYGFRNVTRGERNIGPKVLSNYNRWAEELTVPRAADLLARRAVASSLWSVGRVTAAWLAGAFLILVLSLPIEWKLLAWSIVGLHAVYFPFGFEGIFELSYVFESVPVLCVLAGGLIAWLSQEWSKLGRWPRLLWLPLFVLAGLAGPLDRLRGGITEVRFARGYYATFEERLRQAGVKPPALVFIRPDPADRHRDLVTNSPSLDDPIVRARWTGAETLALADAFPDRELWFYDVRTEQLVHMVKTP